MQTASSATYANIRMWVILKKVHAVWITEPMSTHWMQKVSKRVYATDFLKVFQAKFNKGLHTPHFIFRISHHKWSTTTLLNNKTDSHLWEELCRKYDNRITALKWLCCCITFQVSVCYSFMYSVCVHVCFFPGSPFSSNLPKTCQEVNWLW